MTQGRGCVMLLFADLESAENYQRGELKDGRTRAAYVTVHALESAGLAEEDQRDLYAHCKEYHPEFKFVLTVGVATGKDVDIKGKGG